MSSIGDILKPYELSRAKRVAENMKILAILGLDEAANEFRKQSKAPSKKISKSRELLVQTWAADVHAPSRRSSRLEGIKPNDDPSVEKNPANSILHAGDIVKAKKKKVRQHYESKRTEAYTEDHVKLLGSHLQPWPLFVDGYGSNGRRIYDSINGKTCHQCRQKTMGHRTTCGHCNKFRGQFCGDCLFMRYGENVLETLEKPDWKCPPCRGICNCSFCRVEKGWGPTGTLWQKVKGLGFKSVAHYLILTRQKNAGNSGCAELKADGIKEPEGISQPLLACSKVQEVKRTLKRVKEEELSCKDAPSMVLSPSSDNASNDLQQTPTRRSTRQKIAKQLAWVSSKSENQAAKRQKKATAAEVSSKMDSEEDEMFEVESILNWRGKGKNQQVLIKWKGFSHKFNSWEPIENLK